MKTLPPSTMPYGPDYVQALAKIRGQRRNLALLVILALLTQIVLWLLLKFEVIQAEGTGSVFVEGVYSLSNFGQTGQLMHFVFLLTTFIAVVCSAMLVVVLVIQALLLLQDRRTGVAATTSAAGLAILLTMLCLPWQTFYEVRPYVGGYVGLPGATTTFAEVASYGLRQPEGTLQQVLHWGRFLIYPLFALVVAFVALAKSGKPTKVAAEEAEAEERAEERLADGSYDEATV